ncbi:hypothetical protein J7T55_005093 [Diaporthe amygdali]|uniref:uncharacterized protein n=1 Tax=Phomopsis amygdali TaxID=1214568 RepID=UPI0022FE73F0|nr:uncharacterized protein J7T55_005093 [Diaporthe amygdali]KAJ0116147.1 hypothetical protein J7T55_005093 [Diaporthe amygdali]
MADDAAYLAEYNGGALVGTAVSFLVLTFFSVGLRTYVRGVLTKSFMADDWLMLASQAVFTVSCTFILLGVDIGLGRHNRSLPQGQEIEALKWQALATATYVLNMMFIKLSIGFFLLRLAMQKRYLYTIYGTMFVVLIWSLALFLWDIFQCSPVPAQWDYTIPNLKCVSAQEVVNAAYSLSVMTILTDWLFALLPIPMIWHVKMSAQAKATVVVVLGLGIFASIATLIRLKFLSDLTDTTDILFAGTEAMVWTLVEPGVAIVASSLVTIRPLLRKMRLKGFESTEQSHGLHFTGQSGSGAIGSRGATRSGTRRTIGSMPGYGPENIKLADLEPGFGGNKGYWSQGTTLTSRGSTQAGWNGRGVGVAITVQEDDEDADRISPVVGHGHGYGHGIGNGHGGSGGSSPDSGVFVIEGPSRPHPTVQAAVWRSETPISAEESEHSQGLRYPGHYDAGTRRGASPDFPIQNSR